MFYILHGQDDFSLHQALEEIKKEMGNPEMLAVNTSLLDGQKLPFTQLKDTCSAVPFLCSVRLVIVEGLLGHFEPKPGQGRRTNRSQTDPDSGLKAWRGLGDYIGQMPPTTTLILVDGKIKNSNPLLKSLSASAKVMIFPQLKDKEISNWIQRQVSCRGGAISSGAVDLLVGFIGGDLWTMSSEIDKLLAYSSGHLISEDDVRRLTKYALEANIFTLIDAILDTQRKKAQQLLHQALQQGMSPPYILVMITRQLRLIVRAKELSREYSRANIQNKLWLASDVLDKTLKQSKAYSLEQIKVAYHRVLEADVAIKTGKYDGDLALELLVIELCQG